MNTDHLKYLIAIGKTKSMSKASESLFVTPQALSLAVKKLEEELGLTLLKRSSSGAALTENGEWLVKLSARFFEEITYRQQRYQSYLNQESTAPQGTLNLLLNASGISESQLGMIICEATKNTPDFRIDLQETSREKVLSAVLQGEIELGFIHRTQFNHQYIDELDEELSFYPIQEGEMMIQAHDKYPFAKFESTFLKKVVDYPICSFGAAEDKRMTDFLHMVTHKEIDHITVNNYALYQANIVSGNYIAVNVKFSNEPHACNYVENVNCIKLRDDVRVYFGVVRRKEEMLRGNAAFFWNKMLEVCPLIV